ncbi:MAG: nucleotidyltransferase family protein [Candidatus Eisenbacteria bacterium]|nr:nucleotidyltransferase family protein [Candidatus Eisenbacteria bacterium]
MEAALVVLAAGEGRRAGGPKAWKLVRGRPWLAHQLEALSELRLASIVAVLGEPPPETPRGLLAGLRWAINLRPELGPFSSLQIGLSESPPDMPVFVLPVDVPVPGLPVFEALCGAFHAAWKRRVVPAAGAAAGRRTGSPLLAAVPLFKGRGGHPVLLAAEACGELLRMDVASPGARLDVWLRSQGPRITRLETGDERVVTNLNTAKDFGMA